MPLTVVPVLPLTAVQSCIRITQVKEYATNQNNEIAKNYDSTKISDFTSVGPENYHIF